MFLIKRTHLNLKMETVILEGPWIYQNLAKLFKRCIQKHFQLQLNKRLFLNNEGMVM